MAAIMNSIDIDRPAEEVFAYATDPAKFPEWQMDVTDVRVEGAHVGSQFVTVCKIGGTERSMTQEITENAPPHRSGTKQRPTPFVNVEFPMVDRYLPFCASREGSG